MREKGKGKMTNLSGANYCDSVITLELTEAKIEIQKSISKGEVPCTIEGKLKHYYFRRAWIYWVVSGHTSLRIAKKIYNKSKKLNQGKYNYPIRIDGDCTCPEPKTNIKCFHIDTQEGLNEFVKIIKDSK